MVDFSDTPAAVLTTREGAVRRRSPCSIGVATLDADGALVASQSGEAQAGPIADYLRHLEAEGVPEAILGSTAALPVSYRVGDSAVSLLVQRFPLDGTSQLVVLDLSQIARAACSEVEERVLEDVSRRLGHEVNNPLASIFGAVEVLLLSKPAEVVRRQLQVVMEQADRVASVIDGVRAWKSERAGVKRRS